MDAMNERLGRHRHIKQLAAQSCQDDMEALRNHIQKRCENLPQKARVQEIRATADEDDDLRLVVVKIDDILSRIHRAVGQRGSAVMERNDQNFMRLDGVKKRKERLTYSNCSRSGRMHRLLIWLFPILSIVARVIQYIILIIRCFLRSLGRTDRDSVSLIWVNHQPRDKKQRQRDEGINDNKTQSQPSPSPSPSPASTPTTKQSKAKQSKAK